MSSRHVPTKRLNSAVLFSAPDETQRVPPDEVNEHPKKSKTNNVQKKAHAGQKTGNVNHVSSDSPPTIEKEEFQTMFAKHVGLANYKSSPKSGLSEDFMHSKEAQATFCLPILKVSSTTMIEGILAHTTLIQSFRNPSEMTIDEARHTFPLYDGAAVTEFECTIGDERRLRGVVKSKEQAQKEYKKAVHEQAKAAALLEEHTPEIFETSLGNIPPTTTIEIRIVYIQELKFVMMEGEETEGVAFILPTSIAPRYDIYHPASEIICDGLDIKIMVLNDGSINPDGCQEESGHKVFYDGPLEMESRQGSDNSGEQPLRDYYCWEHHSDKSTLTKDFVFVIQMKQGHEVQSQAILCPPDDAGMAAMMVSIRPSDLFRNAIIPQSFSGEILFLLDQSGSMNGSVNGCNGPRKIDVLREAMFLVISGLPKTCSFNIISWGSETWAMWEQSRKHSPGNINEARDYISQIDANLCGTDLLRAFNSTGQRRRRDSNSTQIVVLTDGELDADKPMEFVWKTRQALQNKVRFFALGIGGNVPHRLIEGIAELGGGLGDIVDTTQNPRWHGRLNRLLKSALEPDSWDCDIDIGHGFEQNSLMDVGFSSDISDTQRVPYFQAPHTIVTLHPFKFTSVFFLINVKDRGILPQEITIITTTEGAKKKTYGLPVTEALVRNKLMHRLAAKAVLMDLENTVKRESFRSTLVDENCQNIGTRYSVTSKWTSFVAVAQDAQVTTTNSSSIVEHYKAMYDGVDFNELLTEANSDGEDFSEYDSATDGDSYSTEHDDRKAGYRRWSGSHARLVRSARIPAPFDESPSQTPPLVVAGKNLDIRTYKGESREGSDEDQAVESPSQKEERHARVAERRRSARYSSSPSHSDYAYGSQSREGSDEDQVIENLAQEKARFEEMEELECLRSARRSASYSSLSSYSDYAYRIPSIEDGIASPSPKPIDPLNWEVAVNHQNG
ncbi:hypothetical protein FAUST_6258 [Fusarium austroamericanum]|uniref:Uncharacterized protein n=1 Tax=Fusarium austroamericanum TaxID=282268 RepID=A0AAN5Z8W3_FUSAU|nr:hypothetical protein FAUST_6258 [Fusarium austroamericanum]